MAISHPLDVTATSQADDVFYCRHEEMAPGGVREPLHATSDEHADMRVEWVDLYEDILAHNTDGSKPFPECKDDDHDHHDPGCPHCAEPEEPEDPADPDPVDPDPEDPDPVDPVQPCENAILIVRVTDDDAFPVKEVQVLAGAFSELTDENGIADFGEIPGGTYDIAATKPGHAPGRGQPEGYDEAFGTSVPACATTTVDLTQHPLCANVAKFEGPASGSKSKYLGFDPKTNLVASATDAYWDPVPDAGAISMGGREKRDGARWVSIAPGTEVELEVEFDFKGPDCISCIENSSFVITPSSVAEVVTTTVSTKKATFKIKGKSEGEASLKVFCDGNEIGWFHIWCKSWATIKVDVACILTSRTSNVAFNTGTMQTMFNDIFRQGALRFNFRHLGVVDLSSDWVLWAQEATAYNLAGTSFTKTKTVLGWLHSAADAAIQARTAAPYARPSAYRLYFYVPPTANIGGSVINVGSSPAFVFQTPGSAVYTNAAHEMGHALGLTHPAHDGSAGQYPDHLKDTCNDAIPAIPASNTEKAVPATSAESNIMAADPHNLMGYFRPITNTTRLRYRQWKALSRS